MVDGQRHWDSAIRAKADLREPAQDGRRGVAVPPSGTVAQWDGTTGQRYNKKRGTQEVPRFFCFCKVSFCLPESIGEECIGLR